MEVSSQRGRVFASVQAEELRPGHLSSVRTLVWWAAREEQSELQDGRGAAGELVGTLIPT